MEEDRSVREDIIENEGVVCYSDYDPFSYSRLKGWRPIFAAIKKKGILHLIDNDIEALGIKPYTLNGNGDYNWHQHIALAQLLDSRIKLVLLQGGAGSGKTILSLATAISQRKTFRQILVTRPMVPLEDEDRMGFLPGNIEDKMGPWLQPIWQSLSFLKEQSNTNKKLIEDMIEFRKLYFAPLDYIRGMSFYKDLIIVDDAQNLTPHQVKTIITRAGHEAKIIFTGDLGQIDRKKRLDRRSSGLAYATDKLNDQSLVAVTKFKETVRSPLASLAEEYL
jgi:PhoH-like ATPase